MFFICLVFVCVLLCILRSEFLVVVFAKISAYKRCSVRLYLRLFVGWWDSCLIYVISVCVYIVVSNAYCVAFYLIFFFLCTHCCQFLRIVHFCLPLRYSLTFICIPDEIREITDQLTDGGRSVHDVEKIRRRLESEKGELQAALEEAESALEQAEAKVMRLQLETSTVRNEIERRLREKEEEYENTRYVTQLTFLF